MKVLILGAQGMLGHALADTFKDQDPVLWDVADLDIADLGAVFRNIGEASPTHVINAAAYTNVDGAESDYDRALEVNGDAVGYLASACAAVGATLVHYSTDYVFNGLNPSGYGEHDEPQRPVNRYGESKLLGEQMLEKFTRRATPHPLHFYLIRTSWLYGPLGKNFVATILERARGGESLRVVKDQRGKPTYAPDLALRTQELIEGLAPPGIYHVTNETPPEGVSWHDVASAALEEAARREPAFAKTACAGCFSSEFPRPAARPSFSMLRNTKLPPLREWREALNEYVRRHLIG